VNANVLKTLKYALWVAMDESQIAPADFHEALECLEQYEAQAEGDEL
jgi:predicted RNA-binding protein associated with RNAse of E/G family